MHDTTSFSASHGFCHPFVFTTLRIALPASPLYSHPYELPGVYPLRSPCSDVGYSLCLPFRIRHPVFSATCTLFFALGRSFCTRVPLFSMACGLFCKNTRVGVSTRPWTQRRSRRQCTRAHAETRAQWRRNIAQGIAAARAAAFFTKRARGVGAQPVASRFALRIDALHGEPGQKLHIVSPSATGALLRRRSSGADPKFPDDGRTLARILPQGCRAVKRKDHNI